jgi:hypothetical protein
MKAIFITNEDIKRYSILDGNLDNDKFGQFVEIAQDIHVHSYLGTDLYNKLQALIIAGEVNDLGNEYYKTLLETYIKPMHIHWSIVEIMPYIAYTIANGGVYKHQSESSESASMEEINSLKESSRTTAQWYTERMINYLCENSVDFPEYSTNSGADIDPSHDQLTGGWVL